MYKIAAEIKTGDVIYLDGTEYRTVTTVGQNPVTNTEKPWLIQWADGQIETTTSQQIEVRTD